MSDCESFDTALAASPDLNRLARRARAHAGSCRRCAALLRDLELIVERAASLAANASEPDPPPQLWDQIRRQLEKEGVIHANGRTTPRRAKPRPKSGGGPLPRLVHSTPRSGG
ncbi:MAG TPA: hypothetical protein VE996_07640 [Terriglobales bacterium]|nr:hypothetical protein [Terriglobales bacterium]